LTGIAIAIISNNQHGVVKGINKDSILTTLEAINMLDNNSKHNNVTLKFILGKLSVLLDYN